MRVRGWRLGVSLVTIGLLVGSATASGHTGVQPGPSSSDSALQTRSVSGVAVPVSEQEERQYLEKMRSLADSYGLAVRTDAWLVMSQDRTWVVFADRNATVAEVTVRGTVIGPNANGVGYVFAEDASWDTTPTQVALEDLLANPGRYAYRLVQVQGYYRQVSYTADVGEGAVRKQVAFGRLATRPMDPSNVLRPPGRAGRWGVLNLSGSTYGGSRSAELASALAGPDSSILTVRFGAHRYWMNGSAQVTGVVLTRDPDDLPSASENPTLYVGSVTPTATRLDSVQTVTQRGRRLEGEVVSVRAQLVGVTISSKRQLLELGRCAPDTVGVPGYGCGVPVLTDAAIHMGVLVDGRPDSRKDLVYYAGLSNAKLNQVRRADRGIYRVVGRVVATDVIDPRLPDGYALLVYDLERVGNLTIDIGSVVRRGRQAVRRRVVSQLNATADAWPPQPASTATPTSTATTAGGRGTGASTTAGSGPAEQSDGGAAADEGGGGGWSVPPGLVDAVSVGLYLLGYLMYAVVIAVEYIRYRKLSGDDGAVSTATWEVLVALLAAGSVGTAGYLIHPSTGGLSILGVLWLAIGFNIVEHVLLRYARRAWRWLFEHV